MVSGLRNVRLSTVVIAAAFIILLFLPLTHGTNINTALLQSQSVFAQQQEGVGGGQQQGGNQSSGGLLEGIFGGGQQQAETAFLPYDHPPTGIHIEYPSTWISNTAGLEGYADIIAFYSPLQNVSDLAPTRLKISLPLYSQDISLQEYTNFILSTLNQSEQIDVRNSSEVTVAGYPGHRVVLVIQPLPNSTLTFYQMNSWTTIGNAVLLVSYEGEESAFNRHLPEVSRMLESLSISTTDDASSLTTADRDGVAGNQTQQGFANQTGGGGEPLGEIGEQIGELFGEGQ